LRVGMAPACFGKTVLPGQPARGDGVTVVHTMYACGLYCNSIVLSQGHAVRWPCSASNLPATATPMAPSAPATCQRRGFPVPACPLLRLSPPVPPPLQVFSCDDPSMTVFVSLVLPPDTPSESKAAYATRLTSVSTVRLPVPASLQRPWHLRTHMLDACVIARSGTPAPPSFRPTCTRRQPVTPGGRWVVQHHILALALILTRHCDGPPA
jgi:hypothetical protein